MKIVRSGTSVAAVDQGAGPTGPYVEVLAAGVCGTDLDIVRGHRPDLAQVLGHEAIGARNGHREDLVVFNPVSETDQDRILGHSYDGVFTRFYESPELNIGPSLVSVGDTLPPPLAALTEPVAACAYSWELARIWSDGVSVGVWGAGPVGLTQVHLALTSGRRVALFHPNDRRLRWVRARLFGDHVSYHSDRESGKDWLDVAVICTTRQGTAGAIHEAADALLPGGLMILVSGIEKGVGSPPSSELLRDVRRRNVCGLIDRSEGLVEVRPDAGKVIRVTGHRGTSGSQLAQAHAYIGRHRAFFSQVVTHVVPPRRAIGLINRRVAGLETDEDGRQIVKVVVAFDERTLEEWSG